MSLNEQIYSLIFSFFYGVFLSFMVNLNYSSLMFPKRVYKFVMILFFFLDNALLYFLGLQFINSGAIHLYFFVMLLLGFFISYPFLKKIRK